MDSILNTLEGSFPKIHITSMALGLSESEHGISKALKVIFPALLNEVNYAEPSKHSLITDICRMAGDRPKPNSPLLHDDDPDVDTPETLMGHSFVACLFGDKLAAVGNLVSNYSGINPKSSEVMLGLAGAWTAAFLGKKMLMDTLDFNGLTNWLETQHTEITEALPPSFTFFFKGNRDGISFSHADTLLHADQPVPQDEGKGWLLPIILLGLLGAFLWYWIMGVRGS